MTHLTRRNFLKVSAAGTATAILAGCDTDEHYVELEPYVNAPEEQITGVATWYASTCRMCPAGCGVVARVMSGRAVKLEGNPEHPVNRGKLCARGQAGLQVLYNPDRLQTAAQQEKRGDRKFKAVAWNEAINTLFDRLNSAGDRVAVWLGSTTSGHLYDLFNRYTVAVGAPPPVRYDLYTGMQGFPVLQNIQNSFFQQSALPAYDIAHADVVFSFGADFLGGWMSGAGYGVAYGQFRSQSLGKRGYLVQFEPRMSTTGASADQWVPIRPGTEGLVAQAILHVIASEFSGERADRAASLVPDVKLEDIAANTDISVEQLEQLGRVFARAQRPVALPGSALTGTPDGLAAASAVQALNLAVGNVTQNGGLLLAPPMPNGMTAAPASTVADVQALIKRMHNGVDVLLVHGANPAFELPPAAGFMDVIKNVPFVVSFSSLVDETAVQADLLMPDRTALESWGYDVINPTFGGLPGLGSQQPVVVPLYDVRSTADVLLSATKGIPAAASALPWTDEVAFIQSVAGTLPAGASGGEGQDVLWARYLQNGGWWPTEAPTVEAPETALSAPIDVEPAQYQGDENEFPYHLHLFMSPLLGSGYGANTPWLQGTPDPMTTISWQTWVEINPDTARKLKLENGDFVHIISPNGQIGARIYIYPAIRPDTIAIPIGQGHTDLGRYAKDRGSNPLHLLGGDADNSGSNSFVWSNVRVKIEKTGENKALALYESTIEDQSAAQVPEQLGQRADAVGTHDS